MASIIALRSTKNQDEVKKLVMTDVAVQERLLDAVRVPLHRQILDWSEKQKLNDSRFHLHRSEKQKLNDSRFHLRFSQLTVFKEVNGHCRVPTNYKENPQLCNWVQSQRTQNRLFMEGKPSNMTQDRINKLDDISAFHGTFLTMRSIFDFRSLRYSQRSMVIAEFQQTTKRVHSCVTGFMRKGLTTDCLWKESHLIWHKIESRNWVLSAFNSHLCYNIL